MAGIILTATVGSHLVTSQLPRLTQRGFLQLSADTLSPMSLHHPKGQYLRFNQGSSPEQDRGPLFIRANLLRDEAQKADNFLFTAGNEHMRSQSKICHRRQPT